MSGKGIVLRRAGAHDVETLCRLCREAFPTSLRWAQAGRGARWWRNVIPHDHAEVWLAETEDGAVGFTLLVLDERRWAGAAFLRDGPAAGRLLDPLLEPGAALARLARLLDRAPDVRPDGDAARLMPGDRVFVELIGVSARARGGGVGGALVRLAERRAATLGRRGCSYRVERRNTAMLGLMRREGYRVVAAARRACFLSRAA